MGGFLHFSFLCCLPFRQLCLHKLHDKKKLKTLFPFFFLNLHISVYQVFLSAVPSQATFIPLTWCPDTLISAGSIWPLGLLTSDGQRDFLVGTAPITLTKRRNIKWRRILSVTLVSTPLSSGAVTNTTTTRAVGSSTQLAMWLPWLIPDVLTQQEVRKRTFPPGQLGAPQD